MVESEGPWRVGSDTVGGVLVCVPGCCSVEATADGVRGFLLSGSRTLPLMPQLYRGVADVSMFSLGTHGFGRLTWFFFTHPRTHIQTHGHEKKRSHYETKL